VRFASGAAKERAHRAAGLVVSLSTYEATDPGSILRGDFSQIAAWPTLNALRAVAATVALKYAGCEIQLKFYVFFTTCVRSTASPLLAKSTASSPDCHCLGTSSPRICRSSASYPRS